MLEFFHQSQPVLSGITDACWTTASCACASSGKVFHSWGPEEKASRKQHRNTWRTPLKRRDQHLGTTGNDTDVRSHISLSSFRRRFGHCSEAWSNLPFARGGETSSPCPSSLLFTLSRSRLSNCLSADSYFHFLPAHP